MDQAGEALPIRLRPRKRSQVVFLVFFEAFFVFALFWMVMASRMGARLEFNDIEVTDPYWRSRFPLLGIPFALAGACGLAVAVLKVIPNSPCYYLDLSAEGLTYRTLLKQRSFTWRELPPFDSLRVASSSDSTIIPCYYYAVAMQQAHDGRNPREILRISASEYGTKNNEQSAIDLAARLNRLRGTALQQLPLVSAAPVSRTPAAALNAQAEPTVTRMR